MLIGPRALHYVVGILATTSVPSAAPEPPPNIVFILADDLGWKDLGCYGNTLVDTPHVDRLAREGTRFTDAYMCPTCSPSRSSLMTGAYPERYQMSEHIDTHRRGWERLSPPLTGIALPTSAVSLADVLIPRGYRSSLMGKWHLGYGDTPYRLDSFEMPPGRGEKSMRCAFGFVEPPPLSAPGIGAAYDPRLKDFARDNPGKETGPLTLQAIRFIEQNRNRPFFCYLAYHAVHTVPEARKDLVTKYRLRFVAHQQETSPVYAAMTEAMDEGVGLVLEALHTLHLSERTVVIFASDNGGLQTEYNGIGPIMTENFPLHGQKANLWEGGIRVPYIVRWPGHIVPGSEHRDPIISNDLMPTLAEIAGAALPANYPGDGVSLVPLITGRVASLADRPLFWHTPTYMHISSCPGSAVREGPYKLIEFLEDNHVELYDLANDISESHDLAVAQPDRATRMRELLHRWRDQVHAEMPKPNPNFDPQKAYYWTVRPKHTWEPAALDKIKLPTWNELKTADALYDEGVTPSTKTSPER